MLLDLALFGGQIGWLLIGLCGNHGADKLLRVEAWRVTDGMVTHYGVVTFMIYQSE